MRLKNFLVLTVITFSFLILIISYSFAEQNYTVKRGETLYSIARKFNITVQELMKANGIRRERQLKKGEVLVIPVEKIETEEWVKEEQVKETEKRIKIVERIVTPTDTLYSPSQKYGVPISVIVKKNKIKKKVLKDGQVLLIPVPKGKVPIVTKWEEEEPKVLAKELEKQKKEVTQERKKIEDEKKKIEEERKKIEEEKENLKQEKKKLEEEKKITGKEKEKEKNKEKVLEADKNKILISKDEMQEYERLKRITREARKCHRSVIPWHGSVIPWHGSVIPWHGSVIHK